MRQRAPRNVPRFAFEYGDTGAGNDIGIEHNWAAFGTPSRSCRATALMPTLPSVGCELFGTHYSAPIGVCADGRAVAGLAGRRSAAAKAASARALPYD